MTMPRHRRPFFALTCLLVGLAVFCAPAAAGQRIVLGVHPFLPPADLQEMFLPLVHELEQHTGLPVSLRIARDYDDHIRAVGTGRVDVAFVGPVPYILLVRRYGQHPLLARVEVRGTPYFTSIIFVRRESPLHRLRDLRGKRFAFGERESTMGYIVPLFMLKQAGVPERSLSSYENLSDHENVVLGVLAGDFEAGAVKDDVFDRFRSRGLRVLAKSSLIPEHLFVARRSAPPEIVGRFREVLLHLADDAAGAQALRSIRSDSSGLGVVADRDYDGLRSILDDVAPGGRLP